MTIASGAPIKMFLSDKNRMITMKKLSSEEAQILAAIHHKHIEMDKMIDTKNSILMAIFGGIFFLSINRLISLNFKINSFFDLSFAILSVTTFFSLIVSLSSLRPKIFQKKPLNLFFYGHFLNRLSEEEYAKRLNEMIGDKEKILKEFAKEIYSLSYNVLVPGFDRIRIASDIFVMGLIISGILVILFLMFGW